MENNESLINETLLESERYIEALIDHINLYLQDLNDGKDAQASELLVKIIEGLDWQYKALELLSPSLKNPISLDADRNILSDLSIAIGNKDYVMIKDLFEYELIPSLEKHGEAIKSEIKFRKIN